ncbi:hypothetical protein CBL_05712 [Carabus blaptoides fortunei]
MFCSVRKNMYKLRKIVEQIRPLIGGDFAYNYNNPLTTVTLDLHIRVGLSEPPFTVRTGNTITNPITGTSSVFVAVTDLNRSSKSVIRSIGLNTEYISPDSGSPEPNRSDSIGIRRV